MARPHAWALSLSKPLFLAFASFAAFAVGCDSGPPAPAPAPAPGKSDAATPTPVKPSAPTPPPATGNIIIGHYASMTGSKATFGQLTDKGVRLAMAEFNNGGGHGGRSAEIKTYDTAGKTGECGPAVTRLIDQDKAVAILGEVGSSLSLAGGSVCQAKGVPMITPSSTNPKVTAQGDMIHRVCFIDPFQGHVVAKFITENLKLTKVAVLFDQSAAYSVGLKDAFVTAFKGMGGQIVALESYSEGVADFTPQLNNLRDAKPQAVFVPGYYTDVGNIAMQARKAGIDKKIPLLGGDGWSSPELTKIAGEALEGCYFSDHFHPSDERPGVKEFVEKFKAKYNEEPDSMAALGYDAAGVLFDAIRRTKSMSGKDLAAAIAATKNFQGVTGVITIDPQRNASKPAVMLQVKAGKFVAVASVAPPEAAPAPVAPAPANP